MTTQVYLTMQGTPKQFELMLKILDGVIAEGTAGVARYCGTKMSNDAHDIVISLDGAAKRLRKALKDQKRAKGAAE